MKLGFRGQLSREHKTGHRPDEWIIEGSDQPFEPTWMQYHIVIGVGHDL